MSVVEHASAIAGPSGETPQASPSLDVPPLSEIFRDHFDATFRFLRRMGAEPADAEDLCQEVFLRVHRSLATFDSARPVRPWIYGIAYNVYRDAKKRAYRRRESLDETIMERGDFATPAQIRAVRTDDARTLVHLALAALPERLRPIFVLHELEHRPIPEVAELLEIPIRTAYDRLEKAREQFGKTVRRLARKRVGP